MFCPNCGNQVADGDKVCWNCGTALAKPVAAPFNAIEAFNEKKPANKNRIVGIAAVAIVAVAVLTLIFTVFPFGTSMETVVEKSAEAIVETDYAALNKYLAFDFVDVAEDQLCYLYDDLDTAWKSINYYYDEDIDSTKQYFKMLTNRTKKRLALQYGEKYKLETELLSTREFEPDEVRTYIRKIEDEFDRYDINISEYMDTRDVKSVVKATVRVTITGKENAGSQKVTVYVAKVGHKWKLLMLESISI